MSAVCLPCLRAVGLLEAAIALERQLRVRHQVQLELLRRVDRHSQGLRALQVQTQALQRHQARLLLPQQQGRVQRHQRTRSEE